MAEDATVKGIQPSTENFDGSKLRIAIVHARWNKIIIDALVKGAVETLKQRGVQDKSITVLEVPGSFELPFAVKTLVTSILSIQYFTLTKIYQSYSGLQDWGIVNSCRSPWGYRPLGRGPGGSSNHLQWSV